MGKGRLEAFSDGVIAIIITVMVLELTIPHDPSLGALLQLAPLFLSYVLSFIFIGIYWNNHHHMMHLCHKVTGGILWANLHLLFWLSLVPFTTGWVGENHFASLTVACYGVVLLMSGLAYWILQNAIICTQGKSSVLRKAVGKDLKGKLSLLLYIMAIATTLYSQWIAVGIYILVALMWFVPDKRIEKMLTE